MSKRPKPPSRIKVLVSAGPDVSRQRRNARETEELPEGYAPAQIFQFLAGRVKSKSISLDKIREEMNRLEGELDALTGNIKTKLATGYELKEVQVAVGLSAQGSIAIVTAGVQTTLTLVYSR